MLHAHLLPALTTEEELAQSTVVVIDVLRASTTITHALASGATDVVPCLEVEDARSTAAGLEQGACLLGGERGGLLIEGFHLGNSPIDYTPRRVQGKRVIFTTSNGTKAMMLCRQAQRIVVGSFVNLSAVVELCKNSENVQLLCAGTNGRITREDVLFAGAVVEKLLAAGAPDHALNDSARLAADAWSTVLQACDSREDRDLPASVSAALRRTQGGRNLRALGLEGDIDTAAQVDRFNIVPELDLDTWTIRQAKL